MFKLFEKMLSPFPDEPIKTPPTGFWAFIWRCTVGCRPLIIAMAIVTAMIGAFEAMLFAILGYVVDWLTAIEPAKLWETQGYHLTLLAILLISSVVLIAIQTMLKHQALAGNLPMRLRWNFHRLMLNQSLNFFQDEFAGRISAKVMQTALAVRDTCFILTDILVFIVIYFLTITGMISGFNTWLLIPFFGWLIGYLAALYCFVPRIGKVAREQADARSLMTGRITDAYTNISTVKLFSHAGKEARYAREAMKEFLGSVNQQMRLVSQIEIVNHALNISLILATTGMALYLWTLDLVGVGAIAAVTAMALRLNGMSQWIMWEMAMLFENVGTVQDGINTLTRPNLIHDKPDAKSLTVTQGKIEFKDVTFSYDKAELAPVIKHLNLVIQPGEKIGLVGRSGAGKSTLINLLLRFYDIGQGEILIDGQNISAVTQASLRANIGMVTQDTSLLHRSVRENILYGKPDATDAAMQEAAKRAEADEFIQTLTDAAQRQGYDAHVGERGVKLSGGQRQRISIARVMLKDAPILLLDEATSALDSEVELAIQDSLYRLMEGKTVVAIAHRLSTIAAMDRLLVFDQGHIVEQGSHQALLEKGGLYAQLWAHQTGGFIGD